VIHQDTTLGAEGGKCFYFSSDYVEILCVPSATHVPYIFGNQNKVNDIIRFVTLFWKLICILVDAASLEEGQGITT